MTKLDRYLNDLNSVSQSVINTYKNLTLDTYKNFIAKIKLLDHRKFFIKYNGNFDFSLPFGDYYIKADDSSSYYHTYKLYSRRYKTPIFKFNTPNITSHGERHNRFVFPISLYVGSNSNLYVEFLYISSHEKDNTRQLYPAFPTSFTSFLCDLRNGKDVLDCKRGRRNGSFVFIGDRVFDLRESRFKKDYCENGIKEVLIRKSTGFRLGISSEPDSFIDAEYIFEANSITFYRLF